MRSKNTVGGVCVWFCGQRMGLTGQPDVGSYAQKSEVWSPAGMDMNSSKNCFIYILSKSFDCAW